MFIKIFTLFCTVMPIHTHTQWGKVIFTKLIDLTNQTQTPPDDVNGGKKRFSEECLPASGLVHD
jgi:hypothetical protein